jgi:putative endonuclease
MHPSASSSHPPHVLGRRAEELAARFFRRRGWRILARNYRFGRREVDLVVQRDGLVVFVEVKARAGGGFGDPAEAITWRKRREIEAVATHFLTAHALLEAPVRFDAVTVRRPGRGARTEVVHVPDAWRPGWP